jgi:8-hydroxy-5-deazaflavin:NADPH oxidoreductase
LEDLVNIAVLGTGMVGRTLGGALATLGHDVVIGTRNVDELMARTKSTRGGRVPPFSQWHADNPAVRVETFADAVAGAEIVILATVGNAALDVLNSAGDHNLEAKVLIDVSNALDMSHSPPVLFVCNTESLAERIQDAFPRTKVVKALNTMNASVMANPRAVGGGDHNVFMSGNDADAKERVAALLREFGWEHIVDLGDITTARGTEMYLPLWLRAVQALGTPTFNVKLVT